MLSQTLSRKSPTHRRHESFVIDSKDRCSFSSRLDTALKKNKYLSTFTAAIRTLQCTRDKTFDSCRNRSNLRFSTPKTVDSLSAAPGRSPLPPAPSTRIWCPHCGATLRSRQNRRADTIGQRLRHWRRPAATLAATGRTRPAAIIRPSPFRLMPCFWRGRALPAAAPSYAAGAPRAAPLSRPM